MLFTYLEWSDCSSTCRVSGQDYPRHFRKVNKSSIIQARNGGKPECPSNLVDQVDSAPCNTRRIGHIYEEYGIGELPQNEKSPIPSTTDVEQLSEQAPGMFNISAGEATEEQISPFIRNKKVRLMLIVNFISTVINMLLLLVLITLIIWSIILSAHIRSATGIVKFPCFLLILNGLIARLRVEFLGRIIHDIFAK
ncbi:hypothetical protein WUBG_14703 [Wuchereria bancrofti]|uniref:Uncharacterized protein n=1 Tax=Wuchereria bancrofti TaxID=6293 RepID=J9EG49_WUCBA|nr:hypothetical protein WUBG_14703 [Wuchereria bancrofti]